MKITGLKENRIIVMPVLAGAALILIIPVIRMAGLLRAQYRECRLNEYRVASAEKSIASPGALSGGGMLTSEGDVSAALDELMQHGKAMGVIFHSVKTAQITVEPGGRYNILPIETEIEGGERKVAAFLGALTGLKKGLLRVRSFDITPLKDDRTKLTVHLTLNMYLAVNDDKK